VLESCKCGAYKCGLDSAAIGFSQRRGFVNTAVRKAFHRSGRFLDLSKYKLFRKILPRQYCFHCSRLLVQQWLLFHNGYNQHTSVCDDARFNFQLQMHLYRKQPKQNSITLLKVERSMYFRNSQLYFILTFICLRATLSYDVAHRAVRS
jgi:hypothetical protein